LKFQEFQKLTQIVLELSFELNYKAVFSTILKKEIPVYISRQGIETLLKYSHIDDI